MDNAPTSIELYGLKEATISKIMAVFKMHVEVEQAILYGSRAKGNYRHGSDIDLTLLGEDLSYSLLNRIETEIDDLLLPYSVDLSLYAQIDNQDLVTHIQRVGKVFYRKY